MYLRLKDLFLLLYYFLKARGGRWYNFYFGKLIAFLFIGLKIFNLKNIFHEYLRRMSIFLCMYKFYIYPLSMMILFWFSVFLFLSSEFDNLETTFI
jgi:hypothetical protein